MILYYALRLAGVVRRIPLGLAYFLGDVVATLMWWLWREPRRMAIENMMRVTGDRRAAGRAARYSFLNYTRYAIDFLRSPKLTPQEAAARVEFDQWDKVEEAFAHGKGVLFLLMHFGNWDVGGAMLTARGYPMNVIADPFGNDKTNEVIVQTRGNHGMHVIPVDRSAAGIVRALKRNEALAMLIDIPMPDGKGVEVQFFGAPVRVPDGPARIALRTGARVIPVALPRRKATSDHLICLADFDIAPELSGDSECDVRALTQRIFAAHERFVRAYPDQWYIFRRMWPERIRNTERAKRNTAPRPVAPADGSQEPFAPAPPIREPAGDRGLREGFPAISHGSNSTESER